VSEVEERVITAITGAERSGPLFKFSGGGEGTVENSINYSHSSRKKETERKRFTYILVHTYMVYLIKQVEELARR